MALYKFDFMFYVMLGNLLLDSATKSIID